MRVDPPHKLRSRERENQSEQHLDWQAIGRAIEVAERKSIYGLPKTECSKYHSHRNQCNRQAVTGLQFRRRLSNTRALRQSHSVPRCHIVNCSPKQTW